MSLTAKLLSASGGGVDKLYSDDVFSAYTYTGNGSTQTINNGIDLAGKGGLVWSKGRSIAFSNYLTDTVRGAANNLSSDVTAAQSADSYYSGFNSNGYGINGAGALNSNANTYVSWTFRKAPKFFDVVTYTGNGVATRDIPHSLGIYPGMIIWKRTDAASDWLVRTRTTAGSSDGFLRLNTTAAKATEIGVGYGSSTVFSVSAATTSGVWNINGATYVAYLFAHDPSADGIIQCGSYVADGSATTTVTLGWEPQFIITKAATGGAAQWYMVDASRGLGAQTYSALYANLNNSEAASATGMGITATGFATNGLAGGGSQTHIYCAIRRPNKPPTLGTQVYNAIARTGTGAAATVTGVGFAPDLHIGSGRTTNYSVFEDRLRGATKYLHSMYTQVETADANLVTAFNMDGVTLGTDASGLKINSSGEGVINHFFKRAPGVFDVVCWPGDGTDGKAINHSLNAVPEMVIYKVRNLSGYWITKHTGITNGKVLELNSTAVPWTYSTLLSASTNSTFLVNGSGSPNYDSNNSGYTYVSYLFATKAGISKVGSYTGNGGTQTINCGFTTGSRFVMIKRTDSTGDWYVWDSVRGIVAGNDPHLSLNTTAAEVTTDDSIDPSSSGFIVNQVAATNINVNAASYIFLSFA